MTGYRYTLYLRNERLPGRPMRLDENPAYRDYPHEIITDEPIPVAQHITDHIVLDGGGAKVLRVIRVDDDEVTVHADSRTIAVPFRNAEEEA